MTADRAPAGKTVAVGLLLAAFALWPIAHHLVAKRYFVSPWRLFGWAMYCVPVYKPNVQLFVPGDAGPVEIAFPRAEADDARVFERFVRQRSELGTLAGPEDLGRIVFRRHPRLDRVTVRVTQPVYHYDSDSIRRAYFEYALERLEPP